jgi:hypothetical protein
VLTRAGTSEFKLKEIRDTAAAEAEPTTVERAVECIA